MSEGANSEEPGTLKRPVTFKASRRPRSIQRAGCFFCSFPLLRTGLWLCARRTSRFPPRMHLTLDMRSGITRFRLPTIRSSITLATDACFQISAQFCVLVPGSKQTGSGCFGVVNAADDSQSRAEIRRQERKSREYHGLGCVIMEAPLLRGLSWLRNGPSAPREVRLRTR